MDFSCFNACEDISFDFQRCSFGNMDQFPSFHNIGEFREFNSNYTPSSSFFNIEEFEDNDANIVPSHPIESVAAVNLFDLPMVSQDFGDFWDDMPIDKQDDIDFDDPNFFDLLPDIIDISETTSPELGTANLLTTITPSIPGNSPTNYTPLAENISASCILQVNNMIDHSSTVSGFIPEIQFYSANTWPEYPASDMSNTWPNIHIPVACAMGYPPPKTTDPSPQNAASPGNNIAANTSPETYITWANNPGYHSFTSAGFYPENPATCIPGVNALSYQSLMATGINSGNQMDNGIEVVHQQYPSPSSRLDHKSKLSNIEFEDVSRYFYMPIKDAAKEMDIGVTLLKSRCRELKIERWPHRKLKSLKALIINVQNEIERTGGNKEMYKELETLMEYKKGNGAKSKYQNDTGDSETAADVLQGKFQKKAICG